MVGTRSVDHREQERDLRERLKGLGIAVAAAYFAADSSDPIAYTLTHGNVRTGSSGVCRANPPQAKQRVLEA